MSNLLERGSVTIETAFMVIFLSTLLLGGVGLTDYLSQLQFINYLVESQLAHSGVKPFRLSGMANNSARLQLNSSQLQRYLDSVIENTAEQLEHHDYLSYFIQASLVRADIDSTRGTFLRFDPIESFTISKGTLLIPPSSLAYSDLTTRFLQTASAQHTSGSLTGVSQIAIPVITLGIDPLGANYLDSAILVGLRVFASLQGSVVGATYEQFGLDPKIESYKVVQLRGVVE